MDPRRFDMIYGGQFGKMSGLVYDIFDEDVHQCDAFKLPTGTRFYGGIDWGYNDPFVIKVRAVTPSGHHFTVSEFYKSQLILPRQIEAARQKMKIFGIERFYADPSRPDSIASFNQEGLPTVGANNEIRKGIDLHYELIATGKFKQFRGVAPYSTDEYANYHYPEPDDLGPDDKQKEQLPVDQNNHCMDVDRYLTIMTYRSDVRHVPKSPEPINPRHITDHEQRIKQLKKSKRQFHGSEEFN